MNPTQIFAASCMGGLLVSHFAVDALMDHEKEKQIKEYERINGTTFGFRYDTSRTFQAGIMGGYGGLFGGFVITGLTCSVINASYIRKMIGK